MTLFAGALIMTPNDLVKLGRDSLYGLFSIINFTLLDDVGYFADVQSENPLLHFWSLAVEEQFYLIFPLLAAGLMALTGKTEQYRRNMVVCLAVLSIASLILAEFLISNGNRLVAYYMMPTRFSQLALGGILAIALQSDAIKAQVKAAPAIIHDLAVILGLVIIIGFSLIFDEATRFPGTLSLLPTLAALLVLTSGGASRLSALFENPAATMIGKMSYSLYLVHWPVWVLLGYYYSARLDATQTVLALALTFALSGFIYRFIETPVRFSPRFKGRKLFAVVVPLAAASVGLFSYMIAAQGLPGRIDPDRRALVESSGEYHLTNFGGRKFETPGTHKIGHPQAEPDFIFFGDSKTRQFGEGLQTALRERSRAALFVVHDGCAFSLESKQLLGETIVESCDTIARDLQDIVAETDLPIVTAQAWSGNPNLIIDGRRVDASSPDFPARQAAMHQTYLNTLITGRPERRLILIGNNRGFENTQTIADCLSRPDWLGLPCAARNGFEADYYIVPETEQRLGEYASTNNQIEYIPMTSLYCPDGFCAQISPGGDILFSDTQHLSNIGSERFAPELLKAIGLSAYGEPLDVLRPWEEVQADILTLSSAAPAAQRDALINELALTAPYYAVRRDLVSGLWNGSEDIKKNRPLGLAVARIMAERFEDPVAINVLSSAYFFGDSVDQDWNKALEYFTHPSQTYSMSLYRQAQILLDEDNGPYDRDAAIRALRTAADNGFEPAQTQLNALGG